MNIESVNNERNVYQSKAVNQKYGEQDLKTTQQAQSKPRTDKLELSDDAKKLQTIQTKIKTGFYDKPEVITDLAQKLSSIFPPESKNNQ